MSQCASVTWLEAAIERHRNFAVAQSYTMSIGELMSLYRDEELILHPEYQRAYRWGDAQKNTFIESILLGIPLPTIFVAQTPSGKWDIVDGLQRLATIFEFAGIYRDAANELVTPLVLKATYELPELAGVRFAGEDDDENALSTTMRIEFRRARMTVVVLMPESFETARLELFIRLNTLGSPLKQQDVRDVVLIATDTAFFTWFEDLANDEGFAETTDLPSFDKRALGHELLQRLLAFSALDGPALEDIPDIDAWLNFRTRNLPEEVDQNEVEEKFRKTFRLLHTACGKDTFRIVAGATDGAGPFAIGLFDEIALGLFANVDDYGNDEGEKVGGVIAGLRASFESALPFASRIVRGRDAFRRA